MHIGPRIIRRRSGGREQCSGAHSPLRGWHIRYRFILRLCKHAQATAKRYQTVLCCSHVQCRLMCTRPGCTDSHPHAAVVCLMQLWRWRWWWQRLVGLARTHASVDHLRNGRAEKGLKGGQRAVGRTSRTALSMAGSLLTTMACGQGAMPAAREHASTEGEPRPRTCQGGAGARLAQWQS